MMLQHNIQKRYLAASSAVQPGYFQQSQVQPSPVNLLYESRPPAHQPIAANRSLISEAAPASVVEDETRRLRNQ
jgi:hypothetical protein